MRSYHDKPRIGTADAHCVQYTVTDTSLSARTREQELSAADVCGSSPAQTRSRVEWRPQCDGAITARVPCAALQQCIGGYVWMSGGEAHHLRCQPWMYWSGPIVFP